MGKKSLNQRAFGRKQLLRRRGTKSLALVTIVTSALLAGTYASARSPGDTQVQINSRRTQIAVKDRDIRGQKAIMQDYELLAKTAKDPANQVRTPGGTPLMTQVKSIEATLNQYKRNLGVVYNENDPQIASLIGRKKQLVRDYRARMNQLISVNTVLRGEYGVLSYQDLHNNIRSGETGRMPPKEGWTSY